MRAIDYEDLGRNLTTLLAMVLSAWLLHAHGWPWYSWLPASLLVGVGMSGLWVVVWYVRRKLTYPRRARARKASRRRAADDTPPAP